MLDSDPDDLGSAKNRQKEELARRVSLLLDAWEFERKAPLTYPQVSEYLSQHGLGLSRQRWSYLTNGTGFLVTDHELLAALAELFEVPDTYLLDLESDAPEALQARLTFVQDMRELRVQRFAARNLAGVSPETLQLITDAIRKSRAKRQSRDAGGS